MQWRRLDNNGISRKPIFMIDQFIPRAAYVGLRYGRPLQFFLADFPSGGTRRALIEFSTWPQPFLPPGQI